MKLSITLTDKDKNEYTSIESCLIDNTIWNTYLDNSGIVTDSETTWKITWLEILRLLKWIWDNWIQIKENPYTVWKNITIEKC